MPTSCCVPNCNSNYGSAGSVHVFKFPKDPLLKEKWVKYIHRASWQPKQSSVVCIKHFDGSCIIKEDKYVKPDGSVTVVPRKKITLKKEAYPTVFPNQPSYMTINVTKQRTDPNIRNYKKKLNLEQLKQKQEEQQSISDFSQLKTKYKYKLKNIEFLTIVEKDSFIVFINMQNLDNNCPMIKSSLRIKNDLIFQIFGNYCMETHKYKNIKYNVCDSWSKLQDLIDLIQSDTENDNKNSLNFTLNSAVDILENCRRYDTDLLTLTKLNFLIAQIRLVICKDSPKYTPEMLTWSCTLFYSHPAAYKFLRKSECLTLPHMSYLKKICSVGGVSESGINDSHLRYLSEKLKTLDEKEKIVNILFDEIYVKSQINYKSGKLEGLSSTDNTKTATTIQTFMLTSVLSKNKDVIGLFPVQNLTSEYLVSLIRTVIEKLIGIRYEILCLISDNNKVNRKAFETLSEGPLKHYIINKFNNKPIYLLFDLVHLFKSVRNNWLNQKVRRSTFPLWGLEDVQNLILNLDTLLRLSKGSCGNQKQTPTT